MLHVFEGLKLAQCTIKQPPGLHKIQSFATQTLKSFAPRADINPSFCSPRHAIKCTNFKHKYQDSSPPSEGTCHYSIGMETITRDTWFSLPSASTRRLGCHVWLLVWVTQNMSCIINQLLCSNHNTIRILLQASALLMFHCIQQFRHPSHSIHITFITEIFHHACLWLLLSVYHSV